eukprot:Hpha_TRINITY_DN22108_c0_g1::TRINITY_DN22108_c0_g1_i1::g.103696::m.103696
MDGDGLEVSKCFQGSRPILLAFTLGFYAGWSFTRRRAHTVSTRATAAASAVADLNVTFIRPEVKVTVSSPNVTVIPPHVPVIQPFPEKPKNLSRCGDRRRYYHGWNHMDTIPIESPTWFFRNLTAAEAIHSLFARDQEVVKNRFFVESGAHDGCGSSLTVDLEEWGWEGLLVEADPFSFAAEGYRNRGVWKMNCAVGAKDSVYYTSFSSMGEASRAG